MLNFVSLIIGVVALLCAVVAFIPLARLGQLADRPAGADRRRGRRGKPEQ